MVLVCKTLGTIASPKTCNPMTNSKTQAALDRLSKSIEEDALKMNKLESLFERIKQITDTTRIDQAVSVIESIKQDLEDTKAQIQELCEAAGVNHKGNLLQKLRAMKTQTLALPDWCEFYPSHWVKEKKVERTEVSYCVWRTVTTHAVTAKQAQYRLLRIQPLLARCLSEISDEQTVKDAFFTLEYEDFLEGLFGCLREGTGATVTVTEEELADTLTLA